MQSLTFSHALCDECAGCGYAVTTLCLDGVLFSFDHPEFTTRSLEVIAKVALSIAYGSGLPGLEAEFRPGYNSQIARFTHRYPTRFELLEERRGADGAWVKSAPHVVAEVDSMNFAVSVAKQLHSLYRTHGYLGFRQRAGYPFPLDTYVSIRACIDLSPFGEQLRQTAHTGTYETETKLLHTEPRWSATRLLREADRFELF